MELINSTRMVAGYTMGLDASARELLVVVVKGTFRIPEEQGAVLRLHEEQVPLVMSDVFFGEPGLSAPKYEVDFAPRKQRCDVLLNGTAYAPGGRPTERCTVGVRIGSWSKSMTVVGDRVWFSAGSVRSTPPQAFETMLINYDRAFGGVDTRHEDPAKHAACMANPSGRGFHKHLIAEWLQASPLPNTEEIGKPVTEADGVYRPMAFGVVGRHWEQRVRYVGTYDQHWLDNVFPFLPADFSEQYFQSAPEDQQLPVPLGAQTVTLINLTREGIREFTLPSFDAPIHIFPKRGGREDMTAYADTVVIEPDAERVTMTWRIARPLRKNMFEVAQVLVGRKGKEWWQQREEISFPVAALAASRRQRESAEEPV